MDRPTATDGSETKRARLGFNGLTPREWTQMSRNVWNDLSSPRLKRHTDHGAVFPIKLAERLIRLYSAEGDLILDPFSGVGTTCIAAALLRRRSIGIELNPRFVQSGDEWLAELPKAPARKFKPRFVTGDCRSLSSHVSKDSVQLSLTSPPYADFIHRSLADRKKTHKKSRIANDNNSQIKVYSGSEKDFGNLSYPEFLSEIEQVFGSLFRVSKPEGYSVWIVKDYRLTPSLPYVSLHSDIAVVAQRCGWLLHDLIIWDQNEQRRLVLLGFPRRFYTNQNCSFIVVFRKP